jgi:cytohesin
MPYHSSDYCPRSNDPLVDASWAGQADRVAALLSRGSDPNQRDERGCSPLSAATRRGHVEAIRALIAAGADADEMTNAETGETLLSLAASLSRVEPMRLLLAAGANPNRNRGDYRTILMQAAGALTCYPDENLAERVAMIRLLIDAGADVNATAYRGRTALGSCRGEDELVRMLLEAGAVIRPCRAGEDPLLLQVLEYDRPRPSRESGILRLIAAGAEVNAANEDGETPLKRACAVGGRRVVAALLETGARRVGATSPDGEDASPELHLASSAGEPKVVRMLLQAGADPTEVDQAGRTPLYRASVSGRPEVIRVLLAAGVDPNAGRQRGRSALRAAAYHGHEECVSVLLEAGADIDARIEREVTTLHLASLMRRLSIIPLLLQAGANVNARDADGCTPLMWALRTRVQRTKGLKKIAGTVDLLLAAGADPRAVDHRGQTALFSAVQSGLADEIRRLFALGLDVNAAAHDGLTPLLAAAGVRAPDTKTAEILLTAGADVNAVDRSGASVLHYTLRLLEPSDPRPSYWSPYRPWASLFLLEFLLEAGVEVNQADEHGLTPLMLAAQHPYFDAISPLLRAGADPDARDQAGRSARDYAEMAGRAWP